MSFLRRARTARRTRGLVEEIAVAIERYPTDPTGREAWRGSIQRRIRTFGERNFGWPRGYRDLLMADDFWISTVDFIRAAHEFSPDVSPEDLFQALRNVWIINSVQLLLDRPVACTPPAFAYSMLYPWTDNLLDDKRIPRRTKDRFNRRLSARLRGETVQPGTEHERQVHDLVGRIESSWPRRNHPDLYRSLLAIQSGQMESLDQQRRWLAPDRDPSGEPADSRERSLPRERLLGISVRKGGASLLPDAHLVDDGLTPEQERFFFGYGAFLQLCDDLQDVSEDLEAGHETLFTRAARRGALDRETGRLLGLIDACLEGPGPFAGPRYEARRDLIRRNCVALVVGAVAQERDRFTPTFRRRLQRDWPISLRASTRLRRLADRRLRQAGRSIRERTGGSSIFDLIRRQA